MGEFFCSWENGAEMKTRSSVQGGEVFQDGASQTQFLLADDDDDDDECRVGEGAD